MELEDLKETAHHNLVKFINSNLDDPHIQMQFVFTVNNLVQTFARNGWVIVDDNHRGLQFTGLTFENGTCYNVFQPRR